MPKHRESKILPFAAEIIYDIVQGVEEYPDFLPWCSDLKIIEKSKEVIIADMFIGYQLLNERFRSIVKLTPKTRIDVEYHSGPFKYLENHWTFTPVGEKITRVDFFVDFEFKSLGLNFLMSSLFDKIVHRMVLAFEKRASKFSLEKVKGES